MSETVRNLMVGTFVIVSLIVLGTLMAWFGEVPDWLGGNEWNLRIVGVRELRGLDEGSPVHLNGVEIGRVNSLDFIDPSHPDRGVVIVAGIKEAYSVPHGAYARVYGATLGFGGGNIDVVVEPDSVGPPLSKEDATIRGEMRSLIGELITKDLVDSIQRTIDNFGSFADAATPAADNLAKLLEPRSVAEVGGPDAAVTPNLSTVVERIDNLAENLNAVLGDVSVQGDVKEVVRDLRTASAELKETMEIWKTTSREVADKLNSGIDRTDENLDRTFVKLNEVLAGLDDASKSLAGVMQRVAEGRGTAGLLVRDERLYEAAVLSLERLADGLASAQAILAKIERDGYITLGQAPSGVLRKNYPIQAEAADPHSPSNP